MDNYLMLNNKKITLTAEQVEDIKKSFGINSVPLERIEAGKIAKIGDLDFIVLEHKEDTTLVLLKSFWKTAKFDDSSNDYRNGSIRKDLNTGFYNRLSSIIGSENIIKHTVDLTADDGRVDYGSCEDHISLLTCDMYRKYVYILDKHKIDRWWWLATAYSTESNGYHHSVRCVDDSGALSGNYCCYGDDGVRPFCILKSNIFVSEEG